jgi:uncharacterized protein (DUF2267 family)
MPALLLILTGADQPALDDADDLREPMRVFGEAGVEVTIATPGGVRPGALDRALDNPLALEDLSADDFDGVFVPGGHGPIDELLVTVLDIDVETGAESRPFSVVDGDVVAGEDRGAAADVARQTVERLDERRDHLEVAETDHVGFAKDVAEATGLAGEAVERAIEATLVTLGERISEGEAEDLARHLPDSLAAMIRRPGPAQPIDAAEFFRRVAQREGTEPDTAERHAAAVVAALGRRVGRKELHDMLSQLPKQLRARLLPGRGRD